MQSTFGCAFLHHHREFLPTRSSLWASSPPRTSRCINFAGWADRGDAFEGICTGLTGIGTVGPSLDGALREPHRVVAVSTDAARTGSRATAPLRSRDVDRRPPHAPCMFFRSTCPSWTRTRCRSLRTWPRTSRTLWTPIRSAWPFRDQRGVWPTAMIVGTL